MSQISQTVALKSLTPGMANYFLVAARLKSGIALPVANAELKVASDQYRRTYPGTLDPKISFSVVPLEETIIGDARSSLLVLLEAVAFVLRKWRKLR